MDKKVTENSCGNEETVYCDAASPDVKGIHHQLISNFIPTTMESRAPAFNTENSSAICVHKLWNDVIISGDGKGMGKIC